MIVAILPKQSKKKHRNIELVSRDRSGDFHIRYIKLSSKEFSALRAGFLQKRKISCTVVAIIPRFNKRKRANIELRTCDNDGALCVRYINLSSEEFKAMYVGFIKNVAGRGYTRLAKNLREELKENG